MSNVLIVSGETITLLIILQIFLIKYTDKQYNIKRDIIIWLCHNWNSLPNTTTQIKGKINPIQKIYNIWNQYALIVVIIGGFFYLFFAWSVQFLDIAVASITVQLWLIFFVLIRYLDKKHTKELTLSPSLWMLFAFSLLGVTYVTLSHTNIDEPFSYRGLLLLMIGLVLLGARAERSIKWAELMVLNYKNTEHNFLTRIPKDKREEELKKYFMLLCLTIAGISTIIVTVLGSIFWILQGNMWNLSFASNSIDLFTNQIVITNTVAWVICIAGGFADAIGRWSFRLGNLYTNTLDINGIYYLAPVLSLVWLFPFGLIQLQRLDYFIVGALIIFATSILISIEDRTGRHGFRGLIVSLWITGLLIYFREQWIQWPWLADNTPWEWNIESVDYYSLIVLSATIFILILSFRLNRLIERTSKEEDQYWRMRRIIKDLDYDRKSPLRPKDPLAYLLLKYPLLNYLDQLDQFKTKTIGKTLIKFKNIIQYRRDTINKPGMDFDKLSDLEDKLSDLELEFDLLYRSKQRGRYPAENLVLYIFALVTIMVTIGTRPTAIATWNALLIDILAFLFSSAICFMTINLIDLKAYREKSTADLIKTEEGQERDNEAINQKAVQIISIILVVVISISFVVLLYDKWMGIWFL